jgi:hypothetical protein
MNDTYAKLFDTMYTGSMYGAGLHVFALWPWILAHKDENGNVEVNPAFVAPQLGCVAQQLRDALDYLMQPDPNSRTKEEDGRRLVKVSQFGYHVVNNEKYKHRGKDRTAYWKAYRAQKRKKVS